MAEPFSTIGSYDANAARAAGLSDTAIADWLTQNVYRDSYDLDAARKAGVSDFDTVNFLSAQSRKSAIEPTPRSTRTPSIGGDLERGYHEGVGILKKIAVDFSAQDLSDLYAAKNKEERGEYLTPWEQKKLVNYEEHVAEKADQYARRFASKEAREAMAQAIPMSPGYKAFKEAVGVGLEEAVDAFWRSPGDVLMSFAAEQAALMVPAVTAGALGGPLAGASAGFVTGYMGAYAGKIFEGLTKRGVDTSDMEAVKAALTDPEMAKSIRTDASLSAVPQALAEAASMGVGGMTMAPRRFAGQAATATTAGVAKRSGMQQLYNLPTQAVVQGGIEAAGEAGGAAIIGEEVEGGKLFEAFVGGAAGAPIEVAVYGGRRIVQRALGIEENVVPPSPDAIGKKVMDAPDIDAAVMEARTVINQADIDVMKQTADFSLEPKIHEQIALLDLFNVDRTVSILRHDDGTYVYRRTDGEGGLLKPWDEQGRPDTISTEKAKLLRDNYEAQGLNVLFYENGVGKDIPDGVSQGRTIFLSNNPSRNFATVAAHEFGHALNDTVMPGGEKFGDVYLDLVRKNMTPEGRAKAEELFKKTMPKRGDFDNTPEGEALFNRSVNDHTAKELGAEIIGNIGQTKTFIPKVIENLSERYGNDTTRQAVKNPSGSHDGRDEEDAEVLLQHRRCGGVRRQSRGDDVGEQLERGSRPHCRGDGGADRHQGGEGKRPPAQGPDGSQRGADGAGRHSDRWTADCPGRACHARCGTARRTANACHAARDARSGAN